MNESPPDNPFAVYSAQNPMSPWHMWGGTVPLNFTAPAGGLSNGLGVSTQVAKINFKRPETWSFFFGVRILEAPPNLVHTEDIFFDVRFDLILGVGRTNFPTYLDVNADGGHHFAKFEFIKVLGDPGHLRDVRWTTAVQAPQMRRSIPAPGVLPEPPWLDRFPAQDVQVIASLSLDTMPPNYPLKIEATALFAPVGHMRPDWFSEGEQFRGDEIGGT